ncbi:hypothetical protein ARMSODRAFT_1018312 [Armillaria solidipes]|uniref:Uncharacterized protein n=1 Tax=Armillaria solidipes TaxID=1076256 RepID=A0A2H3BKM5_9AGAR|nr:hypothetical protein ARMSODRAFT_1018312 [Armillaria solidipes]
MQCKSLVAALLALSIVFASAAPLPDLPGGVDADVEPDVGQWSLPAIDSSIGIPFAINQSPSIINYALSPSPDTKYLLLQG